MEIVFRNHPREGLLKFSSFSLAFVCHCGLLFGGPLFSKDRVLMPKKTHFAEIQTASPKIKMRLSSRPVVAKSMPKRLTEKGVTKTQKSATKATQKTKENLSKSRQSSGQKSLVAKYLAKVQEVVNKNKFYPIVAKKLRREGTSRVVFVLSQTGAVKQVISSKGADPILNAAAMELIKERARFPSFPKGLKKALLEVAIPIVYRL